MAIFDPLQNRHPFTDRQKNLSQMITSATIELCQIWYTSALGGFWANGEWLKYNLIFTGSIARSANLPVFRLLRGRF